ncbi:MAG: dual specificity protein phosphatase family protein, partial [Methanomassiliicoccales archaeon]|nr:dual specificity protein phosphatase family protein [Methanomassiliicoccales archaeon]
LSKQNAKVMIRCRQGKDRTPLVAAAYVSRRYGMPLKEAYELVKKKRKRTKYHWDWLEMLEKR